MQKQYFYYETHFSMIANVCFSLNHMNENKRLSRKTGLVWSAHFRQTLTVANLSWLQSCTICSQWKYGAMVARAGTE